MTPSTDALKTQLEIIKSELEAQRNAAASMEELIGHAVERAAGIWEMDFDDLEREIWSRFNDLEFNADCLEKREPPEIHGMKNRLLEFLSNAVRNLKNPLARLYMPKYWRFNMEQQNQVNRDSVPYFLANILTLQKIKDRLNRMEEQIQKMEREQQSVYEELLNLRARQSNREKSE